MKASKPFQDLILFFHLRLERLQRLMSSTQLFLRTFHDLLVLLRTVQIIIHAGIIIIETISVLTENAFVEAGGVGCSLERRIIVEPLVCKEHLGIYVRHIVLPYDTYPPAGRQEQCAHQHGKDDIFRNFPHD